MATNFLNFCRTGSAIDVAFSVGAPGFECAAGVGCDTGRVYTRSREDAAGSVLFLGWAMAPGYRFMGIG